MVHPRRRLFTFVWLSFFAAVLWACPTTVSETRDGIGDTRDVGADTDLPEAETNLGYTWVPRTPLPGPVISHDYSRATGFYASPFPNENRRGADGTPDLEDFPNPEGVEIVAQLKSLLGRKARAFGATSPVFFRVGAEIAPGSLVDIHDSVNVDAPIFMLDVSAESPGFGRRYPVDTDFQTDAGPFGDENLLTVLPLQGVVPRPGTRHAVVVTQQVETSDGTALGRGDSLSTLLSGERPEGMSDRALSEHRQAIVALAALGVDIDTIVGLAVFVTGEPTAGLKEYRAHVLSGSLPQVTDLVAAEVFDTFCVFHGTFEAPNFQHGKRPYATPDDGGGWQLTAAGSPSPGPPETSRIVVTIPRSPMPAEGYPTVVMVRTGGGGDRPLVDRGPRATNGGPPTNPGTGPALHFAAVGFAGVTFDGPHGGPRNVTGGDEQFLMFNVANVEALRDNIRQTALETAVVAHMLGELTVDSSACPGAAPAASLDNREGKVALMGHSMGATVAPLALAVEPIYGAAILSGAGGSWIENVMYKQLPLEVRPLAELLLGYSGRKLHRFDPALALLQWAGEPADPPLYGRGEPSGPGPHILMFQGIVDRYILPPIANTTSLSLGLSLAGPSLDATAPELTGFRPLEELLYLVGAEALSYPVSGAANATTAVVCQHAEGPIEDGHEVMFQTPGPKNQYRCFLDTWKKAGTPMVPAPSKQDCL